MVKIMPGFLGKIGQLVNQPLFSQNKNSNLINNKSIVNDDLYIEQRTINKFQKDKVFIEDSDFFVLTEGVILNSLDLIEKYKGGNLFETIILMYKLNGNEFFKEFRGSFSGAFFDKKKNKKIIYTNHIGDKPIYYSKLENQLIFGSEIDYILDYYKNNNIPYALDREGAYYLLTYGYMIDKYTLFKEIYKLLPGHYILVEDEDSKILPYYKFDNTPIDTQTELEILENIDFFLEKQLQELLKKT